MASNNPNSVKVPGTAKVMDNPGKGPNYLGTVTLTTDFVADLAKRIKAGQGAAVRIAMWKKSNQYGPFLSLSLEATEPYQPKQRQSGGGGTGSQQAASHPWDDDPPF